MLHLIVSHLMILSYVGLHKVPSLIKAWTDFGRFYLPWDKILSCLNATIDY